MNTKLTLSLDKEVIEAAKAFSKQSGKSLSNIVEDYFKKLIKRNQQQMVPPEAQGLFGCISVPEGFDEKEEIRQIMSQKYGLVQE